MVEDCGSTAAPAGGVEDRPEPGCSASSPRLVSTTPALDPQDAPAERWHNWLTNVTPPPIDHPENP